MNKQELLAKLRKGLTGLPQEDIEERLNFYSEMIDDRMEEGLSEEDAVRQVGSADEIAAQIAAEIPSAKPEREGGRSKRTFSAWEIVLIVLGAPIWLSLLITAFSVILSLYAALWAVIVSIWAVFGALVGSAFGGVVSGIGSAFGGSGITGVAVIGAGLVCAGMAVFLFYGCAAATNGTLLLTKKIAVGIKKLFVRKEET